MEYYIGEILLVPYTFSPAGTLTCSGGLVPIVQFQALYSLLGTTYGGDGHNTFGLPNLNDAVPLLGMHYCIVYDGYYPQRP